MDSKKVFFYNDNSNEEVKGEPNELRICKQIYINNKI